LEFEENRSNAPIDQDDGGKMFNDSRQPWINDPLNLTLIVIGVAVLTAMYFFVVQGWS
jgi:multisubunit Na+/H+ antiporter MnhC subunit